MNNPLEQLYDNNGSGNGNGNGSDINGNSGGAMYLGLGPAGQGPGRDYLILMCIFLPPLTPQSHPPFSHPISHISYLVSRTRGCVIGPWGASPALGRRARITRRAPRPHPHPRRAQHDVQQSTLPSLPGTSISRDSMLLGNIRIIRRY